MDKEKEIMEYTGNPERKGKEYTFDDTVCGPNKVDSFLTFFHIAISKDSYNLFYLSDKNMMNNLIIYVKDADSQCHVINCFSNAM